MARSNSTVGLSEVIGETAAEFSINEARGGGGGASENGDAIVDGDEDRIKVFRFRWAILAIFSFATACNAILWITFSPINSATQEFFDVSVLEVNALSIVFLVAYVPFSFLASWIFDRFGIRTGILVATVLNLLSGFMRFLATKSNDEPRHSGFTILLIGQSLGAIAQPFFTNSPTKISAVWFPVEERSLATAIAALFNPVGIAIGTVVPAFYLYGEDDDFVKMFDLLLMEFLVMIVSFILVLLFFREKPPLPPSVSEASKTHIPLKAEITSLLSNRNFMILSVCFGTGLGFFNAMLTLVEQLVEKVGYNGDDASLFSGALLGVGLIAAIITGLLLDLYHKYISFLRVGFALAGVIVFVFIFSLRPDSIVRLTIIFALLGGLMLPMLPVAFECGVECTYPISEDLSTSFLMSIGQLTGIVFIVILGKLIDEQPDFTEFKLEPAYIVVLVSTVCFSVGIQFYNGPYKRLEAEKQSSLLE